MVQSLFRFVSRSLFPGSARRGWSSGVRERCGVANLRHFRRSADPGRDLAELALVASRLSARFARANRSQPNDYPLWRLDSRLRPWHCASASGFRRDVAAGRIFHVRSRGHRDVKRDSERPMFVPQLHPRFCDLSRRRSGDSASTTVQTNVLRPIDWRDFCGFAFTVPPDDPACSLVELRVESAVYFVDLVEKTGGRVGFAGWPRRLGVGRAFLPRGARRHLGVFESIGKERTRDK